MVRAEVLNNQPHNFSAVDLNSLLKQVSLTSRVISWDSVVLEHKIRLVSMHVDLETATITSHQSQMPRLRTLTLSAAP